MAITRICSNCGEEYKEADELVANFTLTVHHDSTNSSLADVEYTMRVCSPACAVKLAGLILGQIY